MMKATKEQDKPPRRRKGGGTALNDTFTGFFGVAFFVSLSMNVLYMTGRLDNDSTASTATHQAILEFNSTRRSNKPAPNTGSFTGSQTSEGAIRLGHLNCDALGGPSEDVAREMVYWKDIPEDALWVSPFYDPAETKYLTFEPDGGGWNNIRMAMETVFALALAMGRTLVIPPEKSMYLLGKRDNQQKKHFSFIDFYPIDDIAAEHVGLNIISSKYYFPTWPCLWNSATKNAHLCSIMSYFQ